MKRRINIPREVLFDLYFKKKMSTIEIAEKYGCSHDTIAKRLKEHGATLRSPSSAINAKYGNPDKPTTEAKESISSQLEYLLSQLPDSIPPVKYTYKDRDNISLSLPLSYFLKKKKYNSITLTLVVSDLHLGDSDHLPDSYWSSINTFISILKVLKKNFKIKQLNVVLNGDVVSGRQVYKFQIFRNILSKGHFQVFLAEMVLKETIDKIEKIVPVKGIYCLKGTHEDLSENYILYLKKYIPKAKYLSKHGVINIAEPIGKYNVLFTHGFSRSDYSPVAPALIRDLWKCNSEYKLAGVQIERFCVAHSHWLTTDLFLGGITVDVTGGFQKWEYTLNQRPSGMILYLYYDGECSPIKIKPEVKIETEELSESALEYKNMAYYATMLVKHFKTIEQGE